jgi:hypothetical protein
MRRWKDGKTMFRVIAKRSMSTKASTAALGRIVALGGRERVNLQTLFLNQRRIARRAASGLTTQKLSFTA